MALTPSVPLALGRYLHKDMHKLERLNGLVLDDLKLASCFMPQQMMGSSAAGSLEDL